MHHATGTPLQTDRRGPLRGVGRQAALAACLLCAWQVSAEPLNVRTIALGEVLEVPTYSAPATVVARNEPQLAAEIDARVVALPRAVGERVVAGDLLAQLDCRRYEATLAGAGAELSRAEAQRDFAEQQLSRARNLQRNQSISEELLDQRRTDLALAEAGVLAGREARRRATIDVEACELRAPFDAVVTARPASVGSFVSRGNPVVALLEVAGQEVSAALRHDQVAGVETADALLFESNGSGYPVQLRALLPLADGVARTREVRLAFTGVAAIAGAAGRLSWRGPRALLPADYLVRRDGGLGVFLAEGDRARFVAVAGAEDGRPALVGLAADSRLITDGRQRLSDGDEVLVMPEAGLR